MSGNSDYDICKSFAEMDDNILGVGIIEDMEATAVYLKQHLPLPDEDRIKMMVIHSEMFVSIAKSNADIFGRLRYSLASFEVSDSLFFSLPRRENNKVRTLVIRILRPYDITKFLEKLHIS